MRFTAEEARAFRARDQDVHGLLAHWAEQRPDHPVLVWDPGGGVVRTWTYAALLADVDRLAAGLAERDIALGDHVLVHSDNCPEMIISWLACATVGAVAVATNTKSVADELAFYVDKAQCVAAITQAQLAAVVADAAPALRWIAVIGEGADSAPSDRCVSFTDLFADDPAAWPGRPVEPMLPTGIMFTSGTTSRPKAVVHTHANAVWAARTGPRNIDLGPADRYLVYLPFFHTNAQSWSFFSVLGVGATAVLTPKWSRSRFWDLVTRHGITHIAVLPFVLPVLSDPDRPADHTLRVGSFGLVNRGLDAMTGISVYAAFGMTETVTHAIVGKPTEGLPDMSMGRVAPGYEIVVVDQETGRLCDTGEIGELWVRGTRGIEIFLEYFDNAEANEKAFEDGWFKTGDIVRVGRAGNVFYQERDKDLLKVGAENVSAVEVEGVVRTVPGVAQVAVVGKHDDFLDQVPVAFVIATPDAPDEARLEAAVVSECRDHLAEFKVPRAVYVVEEFPTGMLDKLLKNELRAIADAKPPVGAQGGK